MEFTAQDCLGLALAVGLAVPLFALPGYAVAERIDLLGFAKRPVRERVALALIAAHAVVPLLAALLGRHGLLLPMVALLALATLAIRGPLIRDLRAIPRSAYAAFALAVAALAALVVDYADTGRLAPSLLQIDLVKHAAFTREIAVGGITPPADPFFQRAGAVSYYYFYYAPAALILKTGGGLVDARMAFAGLIPWTGLAALLLMDLLYTEAGLARRASERRLPLFAILSAVAGAQLLYVVVFWVKGETWREQSTWLNDQVNSFLISTLWVPHHLAALIAAWCGFIALADAISRPFDGRVRTAIALAGIAFAATLGLSVYVVMGAVATVAAWLVLLARDRRRDAILIVVAAGAVSLALSLPHLIDLAQNRALGEAPVGIRIRQFVVADGAAELLGGGQAGLRLLLLPLNYLLEAGLFVAGSLAYIAHRRRHPARSNEVARLLVVSAVVTLLTGSFVASTIANNDLGWRIILFAQLSALLWTAYVVLPFWQRLGRLNFMPRVVAVARLQFLPRPLVLFAALGLAGAAHDVAMLRAYPLVNRGHPDAEKFDAAINHEIRAAYAWMAAHLPRTLVIQHNPDWARAFAFGLYGRHLVAVSDLHGAPLFGAAPADVSQRLRDLIPVFKQSLPASEVRTRLARHRVDIVVVAADDPVWLAAPQWLYATPALYQSEHVRILRAVDIAPDRLAASASHP